MKKKKNKTFNSHLPITILLVDDDSSSYGIVRHGMKESKNTKGHAGFKTGNDIIHVNSGEKALDYLNNRNEYSNRIFNRRPDIILIDVQMPGMNGLELLQLIKQDEKIKDIPMFMLSFHEGEELVNQSYKLGACGYLFKDHLFKDYLNIFKKFNHYCDNHYGGKVKENIL